MAVSDHYSNLYGVDVASQGSLGNTIWTGTTSSTSSSGTTYTGMWMDEANSIDPDMINSILDRTAKKPRATVFAALNETRKYHEGDKFVDPIDELRVKVHKWLNPN